MRAPRALAAFWAEFSESRIAVAALAVLLVIVGLTILAPVVTPQDPYDLASLDLSDARRPPGHVGTGGYVHLLGTDAQGRDLLSAMIYGLRISLEMGMLAGAIALTIGATMGVLAAFLGGRFEALIGLGAAPHQTPALVVEPRIGSFPADEAARARFVAELRDLARINPQADRVQHIVFQRALPVDVRHNAKIHRLQLAKEWTSSLAR